MTDSVTPAPVDLVPDARKCEIGQEEIYRHEIRRKLAERPRAGWQSLLGFFNSALGIWILSTILVSGLGTAYALLKERWDSERTISTDNRRRDQERLATMERLDLEIAFRLSNLLSYLAQKDRRQSAAIAQGKSPEPLPLNRIPLMIQVPPSKAVEYRYPTFTLYQEYGVQPW